jgi:D-alanyl-D-alanine carboxypeptidase
MYRMIFMVLSIAISVLPLHAQDYSSELEKIARSYAGDDDPAVVVQISSPEGVWVAAAGLADGERPTQAGDRFRIASMSKTFVAVVAVMLADDDVFSLDDPAQDYLPSEVVDNIANLDTVTIRQLLQMRSGIDDYLSTDEFWDTALDDPTHEWTADEALEYAYDLPPLFAPDEDYEYSNTNYLLMQLILEQASGQPLFTLMRDKIFDPLKMQDTYTQIHEDLPGGFVNGYEDMDEDGEIDDVTDFNDGAGLGDGGLISTVDDLTTFYQALLQDQTLLSPAAMQEMLDFQATDYGGYSLGLDSWETDYGNAQGHSGAVSGFVSIGVYLPEYETTIMVLSANIDIDPEEIAMEAAAALLG